MCDPVTIGALAVGTAGALYKGKEAADTQNSMISARNAATMQELQRSKQFGDEARGEFGKSLDVYNPETQGARLAGNQKTAGDYFVGTAPTAASVGTIGTGNAPKVVGDTEAKTVADRITKLGASGAAHGKLAGYDQTWFDNNADTNAQARRIDSIGDFAKVSAGVNKTEQDAAYRNAYRNPSPIGDILQTAGTVGAFYGGKGGFNFGNPTGGFSGYASFPASADAFRGGFAPPNVRA